MTKIYVNFKYKKHAVLASNEEEFAEVLSILKENGFGFWIGSDKVNPEADKKKKWNFEKNGDVLIYWDMLLDDYEYREGLDRLPAFPENIKIFDKIYSVEELTKEDKYDNLG